MLVSEAFYEVLAPERKRGMRTVDRVLCDKLGPDGKSIPVRLYAVAPGGDEGNRSISKKNAYSSDSEDGMEDYINGDWPSAIKKLSATLDSNPNDKPVEMVLNYMSLVKQAGDAAPSVRSCRITVVAHACARHFRR